MGYRRTPFAPSEYYHCYTRGIDGRLTFQDKQDYERFQEYLYLCNDVAQFDRGDFLKWSHAEIFARSRSGELVTIASYSLMPNHFHIAFQEIGEGGSSKFLQKLGTSYAMYFNAKYQRIGGLFVRPCRSKHISTDHYLKQVVQYIHLNIAELVDPGWKRGVVKSMSKLELRLRRYPYSSLPDYVGARRPENGILSPDLMHLVKEGAPTFGTILTDAREYYKNLDAF